MSAATLRLIPEYLLAFKNQLLSPIKPFHFYGIGFVLIVFASVLGLAIDPLLFIVFFNAAFLMLSMGLSWEAIIKFNALISHKLFLPLIAIFPIGVAATYASLGAAGHLINEVTGQNPDNYQNSLHFISAFFMPLIAVYISAMIISIYFVWEFFLFFIRSIILYMRMSIGITQKRRFQEFLWVSRTVASISLMMHLLFFGEMYSTIAFSQGKKIATAAIVRLDYYQYGPCKNVAHTERFAFLASDRISVWDSENPYVFTVKDCDL